MKTLIRIAMCALVLLSGTALRAQQQPELLNLPGDNLNLYAVMKIFQESETLELFEQKLNEEGSRINNLDLNGDNYIDYIKVVDYVEKNVHYIIMQVAISAAETQDVAVFVVRKDPNGEVVMQLVGDEDLYGKFYIIEPYYDNDKGSTPNPGYYGNTGSTQTVVVQQTTTYEVASWPLITYLFLPTYVVWNSPWYWGYYPSYWRPWTPWYYHEYYGYHYHWNYHYYGHYRHGGYYRQHDWHDNYYGHHRKTSQTVYARRERGAFNATYSKPELISEGSARFKRANPNAPSVNEAVPTPKVRDASKTGRVNSDSPAVNPKETRKAGDRPAVKQTNKPMNERQQTQRPADRKSTERPQVKQERGNTSNETQQVKPERKAETKPAVKKQETKSAPATGKSQPKKETTKSTESQSKTKRN
jgi:hypothetical protein